MGYGLLEGWLSIIGNTALFFVKFFIGNAIGSISLIADAFHTLSDTLTSVVVVIGFKMSAKAPDKEHPYGHGRIESVSSIIIAVFLAVVGVTILYESGLRLLDYLAGKPEIVSGDYIAIAVIALSVVFKEAMARLSINLGKLINSQALRADAWHHRSDAITSVFVLVAIIAARFNVLWLDPVMGIVVSAVILKVAYDILKESTHTILGRVDESEVAEIENFVRAMPGCEGVHKISVHDYGLTKVVSMHIEVSENVSFDESHAVADGVEKRIAEEMGNNVIAVVHVDPKSASSDDVAETVIKIILGEKGVMGAHKIHVIGGKKRMMIFHIFVDPKMTVEASHKITGSLKSKIRRIFDGEMTIHVEPCEKKCGECISSASSCPVRAAAAQSRKK